MAMVSGLTLALCILPAGRVWGDSLVVPENQVSDLAARLALIDLLMEKNTPRALSAAEGYLQLVLQQRPNNEQALAARIQLFVLRGKIEDALQMARKRHQQEPDALSWLLVLADVEAQAGHYQACRAFYAQALRSNPPDEQLAIRYADRGNLWGAFAETERLVRSLLSREVNRVDLRLRLGQVLFSQQRYDEAEAVARGLLADKHCTQSELRATLHLLLDIQRMRGAFQQGLQLLNQYPRLLFLADWQLTKARFFILTRQHERAIRLLHQGLQEEPDEAFRLAMHLLLAKQLLDQKQWLEAARVLSKALSAHPQQAEVLFYEQLARAEGATAAVARPPRSERAFCQRWAELLGQWGALDLAMAVEREILDRDPSYFPARLQLAQDLAAVGRLSEASDHLQDLHRDFPESDNILLLLARVLAWNREYGSSLAQYDQLINRNALNPVPRIEAARTAFWGKDPAAGSRYYRSVYQPSVDKQPDTTITDTSSASTNMDPAWQDRVQHCAYLEEQGKHQLYDGALLSATEHYQQLVSLQPANTEALFDLAQIRCMQGLGTAEQQLLAQILTVDPNHALAIIAQQRLRTRQQPLLQGTVSWWQEDGHGELANMHRLQSRLGGQWPVHNQAVLGLAVESLWEFPQGDLDRETATGLALTAQGTLHERWQLSAELNPRRRSGSNHLLGGLQTALVLTDALDLHLGYRRSEEYANGYALLDDIQADFYQVAATYRPLRQLEFDLGYGHRRYTDANQQHQFEGEASWRFTDHPHLLLLALTLSHQDTREPSRYVYDGADLISITHPYWTPEDYGKIGLTLEWQHDLAEQLFCGAQQHMYDLQLSSGTDSDSVPYFQLRMQWHWEFTENWTLDFTAMTHQSDQWRANQFVFGLSSRF